MTDNQEVLNLLPHRAPFLFVDRILSITETTIVTETTFRKDLDFYRGHYPSFPLTPGVILCEAIFQSGALLAAKRNSSEQAEGESTIPVLSRIQAAKFKRTVLPDDQVTITVSIVDELAGAVFFKGVLKVHDKTAVQVEFATSAKPANL